MSEDPKQGGGLMSGCLVALGILALVVIIISIVNKKSEYTPPTAAEVAGMSTTGDSLVNLSTGYSNPVDEFKKDLQLKIYTIDTSLERAVTRHSKTDILSEVNWFEKAASFVAAAPDSMDKGTRKKLEYFKKRLVKIQREDFPVLRARYAKWAGSELWENNVDIEHAEWDRSITIIAGIFANRKTIKTTQESIQDLLTSLRFKRVNYKWYKYDEEYTYYTLDSKSDGEL